MHLVDEQFFFFLVCFFFFFERGDDRGFLKEEIKIYVAPKNSSFFPSSYLYSPWVQYGVVSFVPWLRFFQRLSENIFNSTNQISFQLAICVDLLILKIRSCGPQEVPFPGDEKVVSVRCGGDGTMFITEDRNLYACGSNSRNKLGLNPTAPVIKLFSSVSQARYLLSVR